MSKTVIENVNTIITIKNELKNILISLNKNPSNDFSTYRDLLYEALEEYKAKIQAIIGE